MLRKGTTVRWNWGGNEATGRIAEIYRRKVTLTLKGAEVTRKASAVHPAYRIVQADGDEVLKGRDEIERAE